jgi:hypothetical protein
MISRVFDDLRKRKFPNIHLYIASSLIHISSEQSSKESFFLSSSHPNLVFSRDDNITRGFGYPRISDPSGSVSGTIFYPRVLLIPDPR